jgi:hypothetical protein
LIALALEKLPEKYVNAFSTLSVSGNVDLEKFEDTKLFFKLIKAKSSQKKKMTMK